MGLKWKQEENIIKIISNIAIIFDSAFYNFY